MALGTNPAVADSNDSKNLCAPTFNEDGNPVLAFGRNLSAPEGITWVVKRSTDLVSFEIIFRFDGENIIDNENGNSAEITNNFLRVTDDDSPQPKAFYLFEAEFSPPSS